MNFQDNSWTDTTFTAVLEIVIFLVNVRMMCVRFHTKKWTRVSSADNRVKSAGNYHRDEAENETMSREMTAFIGIIKPSAVLSHGVGIR